jgi:hypothetical protein
MIQETQRVGFGHESAVKRYLANASAINALDLSN